MILVEPGPLSRQVMTASEAESMASGPPALGRLFPYAWVNQVVVPEDHEVSDYKFMVAQKTSNPDFYCRRDRMGTTPYWRFGAFVSAVAYELLTTKDYDFTAGLPAALPILLVGSECSSAGYAFQVKSNRPLLPAGKVTGVGHSLIHEDWPAFRTLATNFLAAY